MQYLVLRPQSKCLPTCDYLKGAGIDCVGLPLLKVVPLDDAAQRIQAVIEQLTTPDVVVVTSTVAATQLSQPLNARYAQRANFTTYAIGATSARTLNLAIGSVQVPATETSEGVLAELLANERTPAGSGSRIYLFKGIGGRNLLQAELAKRGFAVTVVNTYQRQVNTQWTATAPWQQQDIGCVVASCGELLQAAFAERRLGVEWLRSLPWIVVSDRMAAMARDKGIERVIVSHGASDRALLAAITAFSEQLAGAVSPAPSR